MNFFIKLVSGCYNKNPNLVTFVTSFASTYVIIDYFKQKQENGMLEEVILLREEIELLQHQINEYKEHQVTDIQEMNSSLMGENLETITSIE